MTTLGMVREGLGMASAFSAMYLAPPQAKDSRATPVKKFLGPLGIMFFAVMVRLLHSTWGRPKAAKRARLTSSTATISF